MTLKARVLIIEDEIYLLEMYQHVFERGGYEVITAVDGEEGLKKARQDKTDLILLDIMLPKMNGIEVLKKLKSDNSAASKTPVLLLTNLGQESVIKQAFELGAEGYILKADLLPREVVDKVTRFLNGEIKMDELKLVKSRG